MKEQKQQTEVRDINVIVPAKLLEVITQKGNRRVKMEVFEKLQGGETDFSRMELSGTFSSGIASLKDIKRLRLRLPEGYSDKEYSVCPDHFREALGDRDGEKDKQEALEKAILPIEQFSRSNGKVATYCKPHANKRVQANKGNTQQLTPQETATKKAERKMERLMKQLEELQQEFATKNVTPNPAAPKNESQKARLIKQAPQANA
ncbi:MAG TPA: hypothetical protein PLP33_25185 [Leptospiraceae bacterium]|nr:hypothetical protein [Leptospiraceae bacterium]